ncbi:hypothetical protein EVAR_58949_1 [Eumeta japonica]|uniref:Uncharacterized protein n=1 Tax=Eumeta variegata TaxID=151549 RepID=A0A4C1YHA1_EUMVA|nr:hypothetical protein EVAR_58949_1 [Eumeta japonica]
MSSKSEESGTVGQMAPNLSATKLPSIKEMLQLFFFYHKNENNKFTRDSATLTACNVLAIWEKAGVPTRLKKHVEEDRQFLLAQHEQGRRGLIGAVDKATLIKEAKVQKKQERLKRIRERESEPINSLKTQLLLSSSTTTSTDSDTSISYEIVTAGPSTAKPPARKRGQVELVDSHLASSLDATKLSDRKAAIVITSTLKSAGSDPMKFTVNRSSIRRQHQKHRKEIAESLKREFKTRRSFSYFGVRARN